MSSGGSKGGARDARPLGAQILSISCSFWENMAKSYVGTPPPGSWRPLLGKILDPPLVSIGHEIKKKTSRVCGGGEWPSVPPLLDPPMLLSKYDPVLT